MSDIARGEVSDFGAYGWAALRESTIGAISGAIFGPFGLTSGVGGKMALGAVTNAFESVIRQTMIGEGFSLKTLLGDATIGAVTAGILDSRIVKGIGGAVVKKISSVAPWLRNGIGSVANQFSKRVDDLSQIGNKMGQKYMKEARELLDDVATSIKQAGNNLGGPILVPVGGSPNIPNSNVWNSTVPPPSGRQQDFWSEMDQGKKELAERLSKNADEVGAAKGISTRAGYGGDGQDVPYVSDFYNGADDGIIRGLDEPTFYSVKNETGGNIYVSTDKIKQKHFENIVNNAEGNVNVLTGAHGTIDGTLIPEKTFFDSDLGTWGNKKNVNILDINKLSSEEISRIVNGDGITICGWCYSERSQDILKAMNLIK